MNVHVKLGMTALACAAALACSTSALAGEAVAFLADALRDLAVTEPDANVALLARFPQQAEVYYDGLVRAEVPNVRRVRRQDFTWERVVDRYEELYAAVGRPPARS